MYGLEKQIVHLNFGQGIDTKTDPKLVQPGKLLQLENGVFKKGGSISKRNGYDLISATKVDGFPLGSGDSSAVFNDELLVFSKQKVFAYSESLGRWIDKGECISSIIKTKQIIKNTAAQTQPDSAIVNGVSLYVWEDSRGGVRASVFDEKTGTPLVADTVLDSSASRPRAMVFGSFLMAFYYKAGQLIVRRLNTATPTAFDAPFVLSTTVNTTSPTYDVALVGPFSAVFAHNVQGSSSIKVGLFTSEPALSTQVLPITISEAATNCLGVAIGPLQTIYVAYHNGTNGLRCTILNNGLATIHAPFTLDSTTSPIAENITGCKKRDNSGIKWFYQINASQPYNRFIKTVTSSTNGTATTPSVFLRSVGLHSKAFAYNNPNDSDSDYCYICVVHDSSAQATYFIARSDGRIVSKIKPSLAYGLTPRPILANVNSVSDDIFSFAISNKNQIVAENLSVFTLTGVSSTSIDFTNSQIYNYAQLGNNLHIVGGVLSIYDGMSVVEHGFHLYPENISLSQSTGGSLTTLGVYQYVAVYEWTDNFGQRHLSSPSTPVSITLTGSNNRVTATIPTLRLTEKKGSRTNVVISLYRTESLGSVFYRVTSLTSPTYNDTTVDTVSIVDNLSDAAILSNEILYTSGGVLDNASAPAASAISIFKNRIVLTGLENPNELWYSKFYRNGSPVEFAAEFSKTLEPDGGPITAAWTLDDKLVIFKKRRAYFMAGDGPADTGFNDFQDPEKINTDAGCSNFNSICDFPNGLIRQTEKGIYHLDGSLTDRYIGAPAEAYNDKTITSANLIADRNLVIFTTNETEAIVYDYFHDQWGTYTGHAANDALIWKNQSYVFLKSTGEMLRENRNSFKDNSGAVALKLTTAWLSLSGVLGFQRVYKFLMLAEYKSPHILVVRVGYDFSPAWTQTIVFSPVTGLSINTYGYLTYGSITPYGGANGSYQLLSRLTRQKCQAIRFQIEELVTSATEGSQEGLVITSMALEVGMKRGTNKLRELQKVAAMQGAS